MVVRELKARKHYVEGGPIIIELLVHLLFVK
jgi:hypothetical protein